MTIPAPSEKWPPDQHASRNSLKGFRRNWVYLGVAAMVTLLVVSTLLGPPASSRLPPTVASAPGPFVSSAVHNRSRRTGDTERNGVTRGCRQRRPDPGSHSRRRCLTEPLVTFQPPPPDTFVRFLDDPPLVGQHRPAEDSYRSPRIDPREFS